MGLKIHSLEGMPNEHQRDYYVYLLDYGWNEPLGNALRQNFDRFATISSKQKNSVLLMRTEDGVEFNDDVLSWHGINGDNDPSLLPAVLITNRHPTIFRDRAYSHNRRQKSDNLKLILIPLKRHCKTTGEVIELVQSVFRQIADGKDLDHFRITEQKKAGEGNALVDSIIVEPTIREISIKLDDIARYLKSGEMKKGIEKTVHPIHFEDRSGSEFERLAFAYLLQQRSWDKLYWLGETGKDGGRDIWGEVSEESYCYQCANYKSLILKKSKEDIEKLLSNQTVPKHWILICGGKVSVSVREQTIEFAYNKLKGVKNVDVWSGVEFEERLRNEAPLLIQRFVYGQEFPDTPGGLKIFADVMGAPDDMEIIKLFVECFDRPAFTTPFREETNIPDFEKAITDTIEVLNTGMHRLRDGALIRKIPSRHQIRNTKIKSAFSGITQQVISLRDMFVRLKNSKEIRNCGCSDPTCSVYFFSNNACEEMDKIRKEIFQSIRTVYPAFNVKSY